MTAELAGRGEGVTCVGVAIVFFGVVIAATFDGVAMCKVCLVIQALTAFPMKGWGQRKLASPSFTT
jgi:hypothetical protein